MIDIVTFVANTGGVLGLAIFSIWMLNEVWKARLQEAKDNAADWRSGAEKMQRALEANTRAMTRLAERLGCPDVDEPEEA